MITGELQSEIIEKIRDLLPENKEANDAKEEFIKFLKRLGEKRKADIDSYIIKNHSGCIEGQGNFNLLGSYGWENSCLTYGQDEKIEGGYISDNYEFYKFDTIDKMGLPKFIYCKSDFRTDEERDEKIAMYKDYLEEGKKLLGNMIQKRNKLVRKLQKLKEALDSNTVNLTTIKTYYPELYKIIKGK